MRINKTLAVTAGTPLNIISGNGAADLGSGPTYITRLLIQMATGGTGIGYVMDGVRPAGRVADHTKSSDLTKELAPATVGAPGGEYNDSDPTGIGWDGNLCWVDVSVNSSVHVSYDQKV